MVIPAGDRRGRRMRQPRPLLRTVLGQVLRRTRLAQRRTLADVARAARVSMPYLSEIERGRKEASSEVLAAICEALHISLPDLLAAAGRGLAGTESGLAGAAQAADRPAPVIRLDAVRGGRAQPRARPPGDAQCRLAA